jgi:hypothetical protein
MEIMYENHAKEHNVHMVKHRGERTTRMVVGKRFYRPKMK